MKTIAITWINTARTMTLMMLEIIMKMMKMLLMTKMINHDDNNVEF
jgi:hypothetical protein